MAMNKAEKALVEDALTQLALAWPRFEEPKPTVSSIDGSKVYGWTFNAYSMDVLEAWTTRNTNGVMHNGKDGHGRQGALPLFADRLEAVRALRWAVSREMAKKLRTLDLRHADS